jgi:hypothetical protein
VLVLGGVAVDHSAHSLRVGERVLDLLIGAVQAPERDGGAAPVTAALLLHRERRYDTYWTGPL